MSEPRTIVTIGAFDGVHLGHAALLHKARGLADAHAAPPRPRVVALAFEPHPASVLRPEAAPARLTTFQQRAELLRCAGADDVLPLRPTRELLGLEPRAFVERVVAEHNPIAFVEGEDFCFGKARAGDNETLAELGREMGFSVHVVPDVETSLNDQSLAVVKSTRIREMITLGRVADAARLLGRPYALPGIVGRGNRLGRTIGVPTANVTSPCLTPGDGVYAGLARLEDGRTFTAAISVGTRPTVDGVRHATETHLLDAPKSGDAIDGLAEYGWAMELSFLRFLRDQAKYDSIDAMLAQIHRDIARTRELVGHLASRTPQEAV